MFDLQRAAEKLDKEELERGSIKPELKVKLQEMRKMKRIALKNSAEEAGKTVVTAKTTVAAPSTSHRVQNLVRSYLWRLIQANICGFKVTL